MPRTSSHLHRASLSKRLGYLRQLVHNNLRLLKADGTTLEEEAGRKCDELISLVTSARHAVGQSQPDSLGGLRLLEIGCGQRCLAGLTLHSLGVNYTGIDLDVTSFKITPGSAWQMLRRNGVFRFTKVLVRHTFFDRPVFRAYDAALRRRGSRLQMDGVDVRVASAEEIASWSDGFDVIYSFDVFEHLPLAVLRATTAAMMKRLTNQGCCIIRLNPFPGITGGHSGEWSSVRLADSGPRKFPPWEHLRDPENATGDTYLNQLPHREYLALFSSMAEVVNHFPDNRLGEQFLTPAIRQEFPEFSVEELCTTGWTFILKGRA